MTEKEALKLALSTLNEVRSETFRLMRNGQTLYAEKKVWDTIYAIKEALAQSEPWEKFCDSNCVWTDHHPDCKLAEQEPAGHGGRPMTLRECMEAEEPEQEPVAWRYKILDYFGRPVWTFKTPKTDIRVFESQPLYTSPPQRKLLTDEKIKMMIPKGDVWKYEVGFTEAIKFARAIEAAVWEKQK